MKKRLLISSLATLFFATGVAYSQVNSYFLNDPVWRAKTTCWGSGLCFSNDFYSYTVNGDTVINSLVYKKIYKDGYITYTDQWGFPSANCQNPTGYNPYLNFFLRSAGKQMFVRFPAATSETLLYDFNLQVGDTLPPSYNNNTIIKVAGIDSIYTPYGYRKRFALTGNTTAQYLYEGVGHTNGLIQHMSADLNCSYWLKCFSLNNIAYLPSGPACNVAIGIESYDKQPPLSVFPNPFVTFTTLHFNSEMIGAQLNIYNHSGQKIRILQEISGEKVTIERGNLNSGLYFYEVIQDNRSIATGKLIITD